LTPWSNDAISDPSSEAIYLRDEDSGTVWTTTALPIRESEPYIVRHGQGYSVFEHTSHGLSQELLVFSPLDSEVKISLLRIRNRMARKRRISVTSYNELVLGSQRSSSAPYVITEIEKQSSTIFAHNPFNNEFAERVAFVSTSESLSSATCDRREFIGRNGSLDKPAALRRIGLANRDGAGLDPCAALQVQIELAPNEAREVIFIIGQAESREAASKIVASFRQPGVVNESFEKVLSHWDEVLGTVEVKTPDAALDTMLNRWLLYQSLSCRVWARTAFYQSGGAYGFRDQLQDVMSLVYSKPEVAREQIVLASHHQFQGRRCSALVAPAKWTRCSHTNFRRPLVASVRRSVSTSMLPGDSSVLNEVVPFLEQPLLQDGEQDRYMQPAVSNESADIFEHCIRAIDRSLGVGLHGLPLMGGGDWNDG
jgi:cyclic beta-1,2-glucan synthetase